MNPVRDVCFTIPTYCKVERIGDGAEDILRTCGSASTSTILIKLGGLKVEAPLSLFTMKPAKPNRTPYQGNYILSQDQASVSLKIG